MASGEQVEKELHLASRSRSVIALHIRILFLLCVTALAGVISDLAAAADKLPVVLKLIRQNSSGQCTSGQLAFDGFIAYTLERPWQGNLPIISSIPMGTYHGYVRTRTRDRWRIELTDVPGRSNVQIHVGNFVADGIGCVLIGSNLSPDLCTLQASAVAMNKFKLAFNAASAKLGQPDIDTPVALIVTDH